MTVPNLPLHDGTSIPQLGFGVFQVPPDETAATVLTAFEVGYRHVDTAQMYQNEEGVGASVKDSSLDRDDLYITTKLNNGFHRPEDARRSLEESLTRLGLDQVDLFLIHWPLPTLYDGDFVSTWETLAQLQREGKTRSIGVSNFQPDHLDLIVAKTGLVPVVNQVEVHPFFANEEVRSANARHGVLTEAWSPIAQGTVHDDDVLNDLATTAGKSPAQVALRWAIQRGDIIFPKSMHRERMQQNFDLFDWSLSDAEMAAVDQLDRGENGRIGPNPDTFDWIP